MAEAQSKPFSVQPVKMATICKQLHLVDNHFFKSESLNTNVSSVNFELAVLCRELNHASIT